MWDVGCASGIMDRIMECAIPTKHFAERRYNVCQSHAGWDPISIYYNIAINSTEQMLPSMHGSVRYCNIEYLVSIT